MQFYVDLLKHVNNPQLYNLSKTISACTPSPDELPHLSQLTKEVVNPINYIHIQYLSK